MNKKKDKDLNINPELKNKFWIDMDLKFLYEIRRKRISKNKIVFVTENFYLFGPKNHIY